MVLCCVLERKCQEDSQDDIYPEVQLHKEEISRHGIFVLLFLPYDKRI